MSSILPSVRDYTLQSRRFWNVFNCNSFVYSCSLIPDIIIKINMEKVCLVPDKLLLGMRTVCWFEQKSHGQLWKKHWESDYHLLNSVIWWIYKRRHSFVVGTICQFENKLLKMILLKCPLMTLLWHQQNYNI